MESITEEKKKQSSSLKKKAVSQNVVLNTCNARHELETLKEIIK